MSGELATASPSEVAPIDSTADRENSSLRTRKRLRIGAALFIGGMILAPLLVLIANIISQFDRPLGLALEKMPVLGALLAVCGLGVIFYSRLGSWSAGDSADRRRSKTRSTKAQELAQEPYRQPVGSPTEATTKFLADESPAETERVTRTT